MEKDVARTSKPCGSSCGSVPIASNESANVIAEAVVPFAPSAARKRPHVVAPACIPRLRDYFCLGKNRIDGNQICERRKWKRFAGLSAAQNRSQVEAETIDVHFLNPIAQTLQNKEHHIRMIAVECVSASRKIHIIFFFIWKNVILVILNSLEFKSIAALVSFARVIVNHVQNHFDSCSMEIFYHLLEFPNRLSGRARAGISGLGREKSDCAVAPIICKARTVFGIRVAVFVFIELLDWKQFNRGYSQRF